MELFAELFGLIVVVFFLLLGYGFGRLAEARHYRSIRRREDDFNDLIIVCCKTVPESLATNASNPPVWARTGEPQLEMLLPET